MLRSVASHRSPSILAGLLALALVSACAAPGASPGPRSPALSPTPHPTAATASPTASPTPSAAPWSNLAWTRLGKTFVFGLTDVRAWRGGYVGIGQVWDADDQVSAAFFASDDGLTWRVVQRLTVGEELVPTRLLTLDDGLLAVVNGPAGAVAPGLWESADGRAWQALDSPSWLAAWTAGRRLMDLAGGPAGLVALASGPTGALALFSGDDGCSWQVATLPAGAGAQARSVVATGAGFVAVGAVDVQPEPESGEALGGRSAVWTSPDGLAWQAAEVEPGTDAEGLTFTTVYAAAQGLLAIDTDTTGSDPGRPAQAWASADGRRWQPLGRLGELVPRGALAGDGVRMLVLDPGDWSPFDATPWPGYRSGWTSPDGRSWTPLTFSGQLMDQESADGWWLTETGLVYSGTDQVWLAVAD